MPPIVLALLLMPLTYASFIPHQVRRTATSDLIGLYTIHPETDIAARPNFCPRNLTTDTFEFQVTRAPGFLPVPKFFNIKIDHRNTLVNGRRCESTSRIIATTSSHPFTAGKAKEIVTAWAAGGRRRPARWISTAFIDLVSRQSFAIGYDFFERSCRGVRLRSGVGFLWLQPALDVQLGLPGSPRLTLSTRNKYLLLTFANDPWSGCVFVANTIGGQGDFPSGPVSDPSLTEDVEPERIPDNDDDRPTRPTTDPSDDAEETSSDADETSSDADETSGDADETSSDASETSSDAEESVTPEPDDELDDSTVDDEELANNTSASDDNTDNFPLEGIDEVFTSDQNDDVVEEPACFPASASVELEGGRVIQLQHLEVGHKVQVSHTQYSDVFFFSHRQIEERTRHDFIKISITDTRHITLSPDHYVYVNRVLLPARRVRIGDTLYAANGDELTVRSVEKVKEEGLIAPHTLQGRIIVNGICASTYTAAVHPFLAHYVLLAPVRALYHLGFPGLLNGVLHSGSDRLRRMIPRGPELLNRFL